LRALPGLKAAETFFNSKFFTIASSSMFLKTKLLHRSKAVTLSENIWENLHFFADNVKNSTLTDPQIFTEGKEGNKGLLILLTCKKIVEVPSGVQMTDQVIAGMVLTWF
jgi:hypothetical protein